MLGAESVLEFFKSYLHRSEPMKDDDLINVQETKKAKTKKESKEKNNKETKGKKAKKKDNDEASLVTVDAMASFGIQQDENR